MRHMSWTTPLKHQRANVTSLYPRPTLAGRGNRSVYLEQRGLHRNSGLLQQILWTQQASQHHICSRDTQAESSLCQAWHCRDFTIWQWALLQIKWVWILHKSMGVYKSPQAHITLKVMALLKNLCRLLNHSWTKQKQTRDPYLSLLEYRNTPVDNFKSPAQLLMSRRLRSILPSTNQQEQLTANRKVMENVHRDNNNKSDTTTGQLDHCHHWLTESQLESRSMASGSQ